MAQHPIGSTSRVHRVGPRRRKDPSRGSSADSGGRRETIPLPARRTSQHAETTKWTTVKSATRVHLGRTRTPARAPAHSSPAWYSCLQRSKARTLETWTLEVLKRRISVVALSPKKPTSITRRSSAGLQTRSPLRYRTSTASAAPRTLKTSSDARPLFSTRDPPSYSSSRITATPSTSASASPASLRRRTSCGDGRGGHRE